MSRVLVLYLGSLMLRSWCIAAIAAACAIWLRNVAVRHAIRVTVLIAMLLMPIADAVLPASWIFAPVGRIAVEQIQTYRIVSSVSMPQPSFALPSLPRPTPETVDWWSIAAGLYAVVGLTLAFRLGLTFRRLLQLKRASRPVTSKLRDEVTAAHGLRWASPQLRESSELRVPIAMGLIRAVVLLPSDWPQWEEWKLRAVLSHELAHVRRADWAIAAAAAFNQCVFWFNPLTAFLKKHLSELAERSSDDAALHLTADPMRYAEVLLQFAAAHNGSRLYTGGIAMAKHHMRSRIERVLNTQDPGNGILTLAGWLLVLTLAMPVLYAASAIQVASGAAPTPSYKKIAAQVRLVGTPRPEQTQPLKQLVESLKQIKSSAHAEQAGLQSNPEGLTELQNLRDNMERRIASVQSSPGLEAAPASEETAGAIQQRKRQVEEQIGGLAPVAPMPNVIYRVDPIYPPALRSAGIDGSVLLLVTIGADGHVAEIKSMNSANPLLLVAAVDAVRQWVFESTGVNGQAATTTEIPIDFKRNGAGNDRQLQGDALLDLPDNPTDLLAYLTQLAQLRGASAAPNPSSVNQGLSSDAFNTPFSFTLSRSQDGQFSVQLPRAKATFGCDRTANCKFDLLSNGVASDGFEESGFFGVLVTQTQGTKESPFTLTCHAQQCAIASFEKGNSVNRTLKNEESASFSSSARISGTVN